MAKWSNKFTECQGCGSKDRKHAGNGLCTLCYSAERYAKNPEAGRAKALRYLERHRDKVSAKYKKQYQANKAEICQKRKEYYQLRKAAEWSSLRLEGDLLAVLRYLCRNGYNRSPQMIAWEVGKVSGNGSGAWSHARLRRLIHMGLIAKVGEDTVLTKAGLEALKEAPREG